MQAVKAFSIFFAICAGIMLVFAVTAWFVDDTDSFRFHILMVMIFVILGILTQIQDQVEKLKR